MARRPGPVQRRLREIGDGTTSVDRIEPDFNEATPGDTRDSLAYAVSKAALAGATSSVADDLLRKGVLLNTINPGPVNTGYLDAAPPAVLDRFPQGRFGEPDDPARLIAWLVSDDGEWMTGQLLNSEGGFRR